MNRKLLSPLLSLALLATSLSTPALAQTKSPTPTPPAALTAESWGEYKGFPIVFPRDFDRPRIGQEFPYLPALRTDPTTGLKRWVIPSEVTLNDLRYAPFPSYDPAALFKNVPRNPVDNAILGGPVPVVNYIPDLYATDYCDSRENLEGREGMLGGFGLSDYAPFIRDFFPVNRFFTFNLPFDRYEDEASYGIAENRIRRACAQRHDINTLIFYFKSLPIFYPPKRYRAEVFARLPAKTREAFDRTIFKTPEEFPQVFFFSKDPEDPLFAVMNHIPTYGGIITPLPWRVYYVGNRSSQGPLIAGAPHFVDFYLLTVNPDNLCYIVNYANRGAPFAFCGFDVHNPPMVSLYFLPGDSHWRMQRGALLDFYGYSVHNIPMLRVPQASKYQAFQEIRAHYIPFMDTGLRHIAQAYPPYLLALAEKDPKEGARLVRRYSGKPFVDSYERLRSDVEQRLARGQLPFAMPKAPAPDVAAKLPITTLARLADTRGHAAHLPVRPNTLVAYRIESLLGDHPTAVDANLNYTFAITMYFGTDFAGISMQQVFTADERRIAAYNPDLKLKPQPGEIVLSKEVYEILAKDGAVSGFSLYDYRYGIVFTRRASTRKPDLKCTPSFARSGMAQRTTMFNLAPLLHFVQAGTGNTVFETPSLRYFFTETVSPRGDALGAQWAREVLKLNLPTPYPDSYPEDTTDINNREGFRVRATMWITYANGEPRAFSIDKVGRRDGRLSVKHRLTMSENVTVSSPLLDEALRGLADIETCRAEYVPFLRDFERALDTWFPGKERQYTIFWRAPSPDPTVAPNGRVLALIYVRMGRDEINARLREQDELKINGRTFKLSKSIRVGTGTKPEIVYAEKEIDGWSLVRLEAFGELYPYFKP